MGLVAGREAKLETRMLNIYAQAGAYAESILSTSRNIHAFDIRKRLVAAYDGFLVDAKKEGDRKSPLLGMMFSFEYFLIFASMALAFWQGIRMVANQEVPNVGVVFT